MGKLGHSHSSPCSVPSGPGCLQQPTQGREAEGGKQKPAQLAAGVRLQPLALLPRNPTPGVRNHPEPAARAQQAAATLTPRVLDTDSTGPSPPG